jgi:hypothetical protein
MRKPPSLPKLKAKALSLYSELVKLRASQNGNLRCYTCDKPLQLNTKECQLGHFLPRGGYPGLTFHPDNSRVQCSGCNVFKHGNITEFRIRLIEEIGIKAVEDLEARRHEQVKLMRNDYIVLIELFQSEIAELKDV